MDLSDIRANISDQDKGRWLTIADPWTGQPTGIKFRVAGPDSDTQHRARIAMMDRLTELAEPDGTLSAANRESARLECLAACVLEVTAEEDGQALPSTTQTILRLLRAGTWIQQQVDAFAGNRAFFRSGGAE
ncbi:hypothetical protein [Rhizobium sp. 9140]|uniref:hypothetical protein n=1 Tax=Rhizobium sp. 9140 TaxID=1761900 RepID=UPI0007971461|nr:hypothetical protein [Rhizobium sp. 9140]CZT34624.1 hypothetical protein GA0004734_00016410 [Rhizobium sp. 9140]